MKRIIVMIGIVALFLTGCFQQVNNEVPLEVIEENEVLEEEVLSPGNIYLYGEYHGEEIILNRELELWGEYYDEGMRHLFIELPFYTAEYLNVWMQETGDETFDLLYKAWEGTQTHNDYVRAFYKGIKDNYPETIFHGTDVGHQYHSTGISYLDYLRRQGLEDSEAYLRTKAVIKQGKNYYSDNDDAYRENMMVENFVYAFDQLNGESIMGIYGGAHTGIDEMSYYGGVESMANQLNDIYPSLITSTDLSVLLKLTEPLRIESLTIEGQVYEAAYLGMDDMSGFKDYKTREFWRIENAYEDFKDHVLVNNVLPYEQYPVVVKSNEIFAVKMTKTDGSEIFYYYVANDVEYNGKSATQEFEVQE